MNKVIIINLNGNAYQLEENGYEALRAYLDAAGRRLASNPDREEIVADIEQAIADKFRGVLGASKTVVSTKEVERVIEEMGPVQDASAPEDSGAAAGPAPAAGGGQPSAGAGAATPKRLYKIREGAMIGGVCTGLAAYLNIDVTIVRIVFALLGFFYGAGILAYVLMMIILPPANTSAEKSAAYGAPSTAEEFIRRAKEGYYGGLKTFGDRQARREWKRKFKQDMHGWSRDFHRQVHDNAQEWRRNWHSYWGRPWNPAAGSWFALPFIALLRLVIILLGFACVIALVTTGAVLGVALPAGVPLWVGIIVVILVFQIIILPLKAIRHAYYYPGGPGYGSPCGHLWHTSVGLVVVVLGVWYASRHVPEVHHALQQLRPELHQAVDAVKRWWDGP
jgi:phage shock protein PspC (stress-responsive transcriptional regulator)